MPGARLHAEPAVGAGDAVTPFTAYYVYARRDDSGAVPVYRFDIRLQGENETVFLDI